MRRLLACDDIAELCRLLRPLLSLIDSRVAQPLDYPRLLQQLLRFSHDAQPVKARWAQDFYGQVAEESA
ncbi:type I-E CRISPR-associated protein Cse2/CasB [Azotobacter sp. CWF10]